MKRAFALPLLLVFLLTGCSGQISTEQSFSTDQTTAAQPVIGTVFAMDTVMDLTIYGGEELLSAAQERIKDLESKLSVTKESSEIYTVNQNGSGMLSADTADLLNRALDLCGRTNGALDISIYPVVRAWGFTTGEYRVPGNGERGELLARVDYTQIALDERTGQVSLAAGMEIDLGSVAKGYTGDRVISLLREHGVTSALLNLGGNVQALGSKPDGSPWRIAVRDPFGDGYVGILEIAGQAVVTSGGYERCFVEDGQTYWHIIDPATGAPARSGLASVTIVGDSGLVCDGLSTALFVMGLEDAAAFWRSSNDFEAILVTEDGQVHITEGLEDVFSLPEDSGLEGVTVIRRD